MLKVIVSCVAVAGCAASSLGAWGMRFEVWNGSAWVSSISADAGTTVKFRIGAYFDADSPPVITTADGTGTAQALTRFTGSNQAVGFQGTDRFQNVLRTISSGNAVVNQINGATIGNTSVQSFGSQLFLADVPFEPYKEIIVGEVVLDAAGANHLITIRNKTFGSGNTAGLTFYNSASPTNKQSGAPQTAGPGRVDQEATIDVRAVPSPGALALVGFGGLVAVRRRRA